MGARGAQVRRHSGEDEEDPGVPRPAEMDAARRLVYVAERGVVNVYWKTELGLVHPVADVEDAKDA